MSEKRKNLFRIETRRTIGWQVRFKRQGEMYSKFFADKKNGGPDEAKKIALQWRDETEKELPKRGDANETRGKRSETGVRGLSISFQDVGNGTRNPYVQVSFLAPSGKRHSSSLSVKKWGLRRAVWKGCRRLGDWRDWSMEEMQGNFETAMERIDADKYRASEKEKEEAKEVEAA